MAAGTDGAGQGVGLALPAPHSFIILAGVNRIERRFAALRAAGQKGLVVYIGAGDPHLAATRELALAFDAAGVDVLELGVPFSDPMADVPVTSSRPPAESSVTTWASRPWSIRSRPMA